jgi:hypothetical protein
MAESLRPYGPAAPHGPNMEERHVATQNIREMSEMEQSVFHSLLRPDDNYDEQGRYWADMNIARRAKFISKVNAHESKEEWGFVWNMIKKDPLSPVGHYIRNFVIPGAGLGLEG